MNARDSFLAASAAIVPITSGYAVTHGQGLPRRLHQCVP